MEKEALALVFMESEEIYLYGRQLMLVTYHTSLTAILGPTSLAAA